MRPAALQHGHHHGHVGVARRNARADQRHGLHAADVGHGGVGAFPHVIVVRQNTKMMTAGVVHVTNLILTAGMVQCDQSVGHPRVDNASRAYGSQTPCDDS
jgi:hypothetical protein